MTPEDIDRFRRLELQLTSLHEEIGSLAKKKPDEPLNKFKVGLVNELLEDCNEFLDTEYSPFRSFRTFDDSDLPSSSDVVLVLGQYLKCFDLILRDNVRSDGMGGWYWVLEDSEQGPEARHPVY